MREIKLKIIGENKRYEIEEKELTYLISYSKMLEKRIDKAIDKIEAIKLNAKKYGADHDVLIYDGLLDILKGCDSNE